MASAVSAGDSRSNLSPVSLGSSFLISTWFRSQAPFWSLRRTRHPRGRGTRHATCGRSGAWPPGRRRLPRPVADLSPELHVGHAVVARRDPAVDGRGRQVHRAAVARRHLLGESPRRRQSLIVSSPPPRRPRRRLSRARTRRAPSPRTAARRGRRRRRAGGACSRSHGTGRTRCSSAATPPRGQAADRSVSAPTRSPRLGLRRRHEPVRRHLGAHRRGRPAQLPRNLPARGPALQHPLDRVPLVPREPAVGPRDRPRGALPALSALSGHDVLRSPGAGRSGPQVSGSHIHPYMYG